MTTRRNAKIPRRSEPEHSSPMENKNAENLLVKQNEYINPQVELTYDVLTIIFKNLNAKDLYTAAKVCRCWCEAANNEKRIRSLLPFTLLGNLTDSWSDLFPEKPLIDRLRVKPILSVAFTRPFDSEHPAKKKNNVDCPCRVLPSNCRHVTVGNDGIIKDQLESGDPTKAVFMLLPEDNEVSVDTVFLPLSGSEPRSRRPYTVSPESRPPCSQLGKLKTFGNLGKKVKCFVVFTTYEFDSCLSVIRCLPRDRYRTMSGGVANNLAICEPGKFCNKALAWIAILLSGPNVRSWSAVCRRISNTKEDVEEKMWKLRNRAKLRKHSMGFMFACQGRGECMFHEPNVESTIFKKYFPEVPLVGCSGGGEYGDSSIDRLVNRIHQYSTVFMIVTYGQS